MGWAKGRAAAATLALSAAGLLGIRTDEGEVRRVYLDPVGIPTACMGHTSTVTRADVGKELTAAVCADLARKDTAAAVRAVQRLTTQAITQEQFDALVSFTFNVGQGNYETSTLLRKINSGDCYGAVREFPKWNKARGRVLPGLVTRRAREASLFALGCTP